MMAVEVETEPVFKAGTPKELFQKTPVFSASMGVAGIAWDIHPESGRFLMLSYSTTPDDGSTVENPDKINIVLNWFEELKQLAPVQ